ncbi:MAG TPA: hypothetical protein ENF38_01185 [Candidatus Aenigmarchaeota archaeon]|nr:hypothetical protein [Candidatus Aenigmarchaeota archaeon]
MREEPPIRRLVLDILKPLEPSIIEMAKAIGRVRGVTGVNLTVYEIDRKTETIKATVEGSRINFKMLQRVVEEMGGVIHSIDEVVVGKKIVEESKTPEMF